MKNLVAALLWAAGIAVVVSGCKTEEEMDQGAGAANPPAAQQAPKDHPAH